jgi:dihydropyrimidinase
VAYAAGALRAERAAGRYLKRPAFGPDFHAAALRSRTLAPVAVPRTDGASP